MKIGDVVKIETQRPLKNQYNGFIGQVTTITNNDIVYVCIGRTCPCFYMDEVRLIVPPPATEGRVA